MTLAPGAAAPRGGERYADGDSYGHADTDVAEGRAYARACSGSEGDA
ncbi:MAG: hypothetical protein OXR64_01310 [Chloroflexota bacterium]|nr:hypothetical protein [Chloroflexota bacterium]MDE2918467.1 hypothetical protein [Chloroflexota bacterium]